MGNTEGHDKAEGLTNILSAPIIKRSVMIAGHATSVSIEKPFWTALKKQAALQNQSINQLVTKIDDARPKNIEAVNLSSAIRLYILNALEQSL